MANLQTCDFFSDVFVPKFLDVSSGSVDEIKQLVKDHDMRYPCVCKPSIAHGSSEAHKVSDYNIRFNCRDALSFSSRVIRLTFHRLTDDAHLQ